MGWVRTRLGIASAVVVLMSGCTGTDTAPVEVPDLEAMDEYGCGYGFWLSSSDEQVAVRFAADPELAADGELPREAMLPDDAWIVTVLTGEDLYANWCDDVVEAGDPEPVVAEEWSVTAGTITLHDPVGTADCPAEARATVTGLEATRTDGTTVELGDRELTNDTWGCVAG